MDAKTFCSESTFVRDNLFNLTHSTYSRSATKTWNDGIKVKEYGKWVETVITERGDLLPGMSSNRERGGVEITFRLCLQ
ncbi:MAG: hypothetical protein ACYCSO_03175 [Cuniculiplasma sp.]